MKLEDYIKGSRRGKDAHRLERESLNDPFLRDALEGFERFADEDHSSRLERLKVRVSGHASRKNRLKRRRAASKRRSQHIAVWSAAACVAVFLVIGGVMFTRYHQQESVLAAATEAEQSSPEIAGPSALTDSLDEGQILQEKSDVIKFTPPVIDPNALDINDEYAIRSTEEVTSSKAVVFSQDVEGVVYMDAPKMITSDVQSSPKANLNEPSDPANGLFSKDRYSKDSVYGRVSPATKSESSLESMPNLDSSTKGHSESADVLAYGYRNTGQKITVTGSVSNVPSQSVKDSVMPIGNVAGIEARGAKGYTTPFPVCGFKEFEDYLTKNIKRQLDSDGNPVRGEVVVSFEVARSGRPKNIKVIKSLTPACDAEAVRLISAGPRWKRTSDKTVTYIIKF